MNSDSLIHALGVPMATAKVAVFFASNPSARASVRELQRTLGIASASAQRDLNRMVGAGALIRLHDGRLIRYAPQPGSALWPAVRLLLGQPVPVAAKANAVGERARRYGVDVGQLRSNLRLSVEERLTRLDADASFLATARNRRRGRP